MLSEHDIPLFLDAQYIDELWTRRTREGLTTAEVKEASSKLSSKAKFSGLGKLWGLLLPEIEAEISGEIGRGTKTTVELTSLLRALLLPQLLPELVELDERITEAKLKKLHVGAFVRVACTNIHLTPIPTLASYMRQRILEGMDDDDLKIQADAIKAVEFVTSANRAITFAIRTSGEASALPLQRLMDAESSELFNAMAATNDDHFLSASSIELPSQELVVYSCLNELHLRRDIAAYSGERSASYFGQVAYIGTNTLQATSAPSFVAVRAAAVSLH